MYPPQLALLATLVFVGPGDSRAPHPPARPESKGLVIYECFVPEDFEDEELGDDLMLDLLGESGCPKPGSNKRRVGESAMFSIRRSFSEFMLERADDF